MNKKEIILNAMLELLKEGKAGSASVSEIAKKAGIAKGGMYYYFKSKEEVLDALVERQYKQIIEDCYVKVESYNKTALERLAYLLYTYQSSYTETSLDEYLHLPQNAAIHQKSLAKILTSLTPLISQIIIQGIEEKTFICEYPEEYAQIIMSIFTFLFDPGIFTWSNKEIVNKQKALADLLEKGLHCEKGSFTFLYQ